MFIHKTNVEQPTSRRYHRERADRPEQVPSREPSNARPTSSSVSSSVVVPIPAEAHAQNTPRSRFTELISTQSELSFWVLLSAALIAAGLGALHALEPGHGKTIVAAYL